MKKKMKSSKNEKSVVKRVGFLFIFDELPTSLITGHYEKG